MTVSVRKYNNKKTAIDHVFLEVLHLHSDLNHLLALYIWFPSSHWPKGCLSEYSVFSTIGDARKHGAQCTLRVIGGSQSPSSVHPFVTPIIYYYILFSLVLVGIIGYIFYINYVHAEVLMVNIAE